MSSAPPLTIAFTGLMVFHRQGNELFEIGILPATNHHLRINTLVDGSTTDSLSITEKQINSSPRIWELEISNPTVQGVSMYMHTGTAFERSLIDRDFRWVMDLESAEFYGEDLKKKMDTHSLRPLLHVPHGEFYTSEKSPELKRRRGGGDFETFGCVAAYVGCDIQSRDEMAVLKAGDEVIFEFRGMPDTTYEVINAPLVYDPADEDHFHHYYHLFTEPVEQFEFKRKVPEGEFLTSLKKSGATETDAPDDAGLMAPRPQLCGAIFLGQRDIPLD